MTRRFDARRWRVVAWTLGLALAASFATPAVAQGSDEDVAAIIGMAEAAMDAITNEDWVALADLMIPEVVIVSTLDTNGDHTYGVRTREETLNGPEGVDFVERGFDAQAQVAGNVGMVWLPYDLYINGAWSHCGVDVLTLVRTNDGWRIASFVFSEEQPPACKPHPDGPLE